MPPMTQLLRAQDLAGAAHLAPSGAMLLAGDRLVPHDQRTSQAARATRNASTSDQRSGSWGPPHSIHRGPLPERRHGTT
jgi:hypothetical protein